MCGNHTFCMSVWSCHLGFPQSDMFAHLLHDNIDEFFVSVVFRFRLMFSLRPYLWFNFNAWNEVSLILRFAKSTHLMNLGVIVWPNVMANAACQNLNATTMLSDRRGVDSNTNTVIILFHRQEVGGSNHVRSPCFRIVERHTEKP